MGAGGTPYRQARSDHERGMIALCVEVLSRREKELAAVGLTAQLRGITDLADSGAEITIDFVDAGGVSDVLQFSIARNGSPSLAEAELRSWFEEVLPSVVARS